MLAPHKVSQLANSNSCPKKQLKFSQKQIKIIPRITYGWAGKQLKVKPERVWIYRTKITKFTFNQFITVGCHFLNIILRPISETPIPV